ncbi:MAG: FIST N-terminal domain-containing protein, partial [Mucilaginibacter sp.]
MKVEQRLFKKAFGWENKRENNIDRSLCNIVFGFGDIDIIKDSSILRSLNADYPSAEILMCSTAGEIMDIQVNENSLSLVAIQFEKTNIQTASVQISDFENSFQAGYDLASRLPHENLNSVLLISDGHSVNGSELILAMNEFLPPGT